MKNTLVLLGLGFVISISAQAATVACSSNLIFVVGTGGTETRATMEFTPALDANGAAILKDVKGSVEFPDYGYSTFAQAAAASTEEAAANQRLGLPASVNDNQLVGSTIHQALASANPAYRPTRYADSFQFKRLDTWEMPGYSEEIADFTVMIPKSVFASTTASFQLTALVQIDQNAARLVMDCKFR